MSFYDRWILYSLYGTGIPGDGRCLFRSVAHGAHLRAGKSAPSESLQRELADSLRARVCLCTFSSPFHAPPKPKPINPENNERILIMNYLLLPMDILMSLMRWYVKFVGCGWIYQKEGRNRMVSFLIVSLTNVLTTRVLYYISLLHDIYAIHLLLS